MIFYYAIIFLAVFLAAAGQILFKIGAGSGGVDMKFFHINKWVIMGLVTMVFSMLLNVRGLSVVPLRDMAFILPSLFIIVPLFSRIFLKERVGKRTIAGTVILVLGIILFNIPFLRIL